ncbi:MAG: hypothetical protein H0T79_01895 [Deltaproteobacteria bacterium]|nr:hypothetical protein [Deltaproteobacteria bacterium]
MRDEIAHVSTPATLALHRLRVTIPVEDIEEATFFYACVLARSGTRVSKGRHDFDLGTEIISIRDIHADGGVVDWPPDRRTFYATTTDPTEEIRRRAAGVRASFDVRKGGMASEPWGTRSLTFRDPWHNTLCIVERDAVFRARRRVWRQVWERLAVQNG